MPESFALDKNLHLLKHPFYQAWASGGLNRATLKDYAEQYYHHVKAFPGYLEKALQVCSNIKAVLILQENLADEVGENHGTPHPELWMRFAEGVGATRTSVDSASLRDGIRDVTNTFNQLTESSYAEALGAIFAYESQVPEIAHSKIEGLKKFYDVNDERSLSFFEVHRLADVEHRATLQALIEELTPAEKFETKRAADNACRALWGFLDDVEQTRKNS